nr:hypothetical protein [Tanacetum cinerariifolium]
AQEEEIGEAAAERISNDSEEIARVLTSMDAATVLAGEIDVPTGKLLIDDSIPFPVNEESESDNLSFPRPPLEPPDAETNAGEEISVVMNDELECLDPRDEFDDDDYSSFIFVIYSEVFSFLLSVESEDTIFDPGISI